MLNITKVYKGEEKHGHRIDEKRRKPPIIGQKSHPFQDICTLLYTSLISI